jgi:UDP-2,3-diacylglucosamine hydrolase
MQPFTLFISDLHLSAERPDIINLFQAFLHEEAEKADALYILGDLFEVWVGDDAVQPEMQVVLDNLAELTGNNIPVYVMVGNRDFLLGSDFEKMTGCKLIPDPSVINLYGTNTLLMHGDTLCTDDVEYQKFRAQVRTPQWREMMLAKTAEERIQFASEARARSKARTKEKAEEIMDVNASAVAEAFQSHGITRLIHGHTHRPAIHESTVGNKTVTRIVLGDWYQQASVLKVTADGFELTPNLQ